MKLKEEQITKQLFWREKNENGFRPEFEKVPSANLRFKFRGKRKNAALCVYFEESKKQSHPSRLLAKNQ